MNKTTVEKERMYSELATEMRKKGGRTNSAAEFEYKAYNERLKLDSEASIMYMIDEYPEVMCVKPKTRR